MIDHALGLVRGAGSVVQRQSIPFVARQRVVANRLCGGEPDLVIRVAEPLAVAVRGGQLVIQDVNHLRRLFQLAEGLLDGGREVAVGDQQAAVAVF